MSLKIWHWILILVGFYILIAGSKILVDLYSWNDRKFSVTADCSGDLVYFDYDGMTLYMTRDPASDLKDRKSYIAGPDDKIENISLPNKQIMKIDHLNQKLTIKNSSCNIVKFERF